MNLNAFIKKLIDDISFRNEYIDAIENDNSYIHSYYYGSVDEEILIDLINKSEYDLSIARLLSAVVISLNACEITYNVFSRMIKLKSKYKRSILIGVAHCNLAYYQLQKLNYLHVEEALVKLLDRYILNDCFNEYDLYKILLPWRRGIPRYIIDYIMGSYRDSDKISSVQKLISLEENQKYVPNFYDSTTL